MALLRRTHNVDVEINRDLTYDAVALTDWVFFHTPWSDAHLKMIYVAKLARAKVWIDWDDNLTDVPEHNKARHCYDNPQNEGRLREMARNADLITTSTDFLRGVKSVGSAICVKKFSPFSLRIVPRNV